MTTYIPGKSPKGDAIEMSKEEWEKELKEYCTTEKPLGSSENTPWWIKHLLEAKSKYETLKQLTPNMKQIYIVYVTYGVTVEQIHPFFNKEKAEQCYLKLLTEWVNQNQFQEYINNLVVEPTELTAEIYEDYFLCTEDEAYVGFTTAYIEDEE